MKNLYLAGIVISFLLLTTGCQTFNDSRQAMSEREDYLILREDLAKVQGQIEGTELEYRRIGTEVTELKSAISGIKKANSAIEKHLAELEQQLQLLDAARKNERDILVNQISNIIADMLKGTGQLNKGVSEPVSETSLGYEHIIKEGETLSEIANAYKVKVNAIIEANELKNPDFLKVGQKLFIPK